MSLNPYLIPLILVAVLAGLHTTVTAVRAHRAHRNPRQRVVEKPNSHYDAQVVKTIEKRHRWQNIALDRIHEINREEAIRLIARAEATSADALRPAEQAFLDRMAELAGRR